MTEQTEWRRLSFDGRADEYRLARPPYPARVYQVLTDRCGLGPGTRLADHLVADLPGTSVRVIREGIETADLADATFDLIVSATAFHWVRPDVTSGRPKRRSRPATGSTAMGIIRLRPMRCRTPRVAPPPPPAAAVGTEAREA